jgi:IclR family transcriptional regulator, pca regulon regulatory protein
LPKSGDKERVKSLEKALNLLILLSRQTEDISLEDLSRAADISKTTCFRLLQTMKDQNFVEQSPDSKKYRLGPRNISIGAAALSKQSVRDLALPYMDRLRAETDESINLSVLDGSEIVFVERIEGSFIVNSNLRVGSRLPVHCSSMGKVMLAYLPDHKFGRIMDDIHLDRKTSKTIHSRERLLEELAAIRKSGVALNDEELEKGLFAVAGPIRDHSGEAVAALNISFLLVRHGRKKALKGFLPLVQKACREISALLGYNGN